jgi:hypothetical protein
MVWSLKNLSRLRRGTGILIPSKLSCRTGYWVTAFREKRNGGSCGVFLASSDREGLGRLVTELVARGIFTVLSLGACETKKLPGIIIRRQESEFLSDGEEREWLSQNLKILLQSCARLSSNTGRARVHVLQLARRPTKPAV